MAFKSELFNLVIDLIISFQIEKLKAIHVRELKLVKRERDEEDAKVIEGTPVISSD